MAPAMESSEIGCTREFAERSACRAPADAATRVRTSAWCCWRCCSWSVVISLRMGAYPISVRDIVMTLFKGAMGRQDQIPSEFSLVVFGLAAAANRSRNSGGRGAFDRRRWFSGAAAKSAGRSVRAGRFERRGAGRDSELDRRCRSRRERFKWRRLPARRRRSPRSIFWAGAEGNSTAPRCCWRESSRPRFFRR